MHSRSWRLEVLEEDKNKEDKKASRCGWPVAGGGGRRRHGSLGKGGARAGGSCLDGEISPSEGWHKGIWRGRDRRELPWWSETLEVVTQGLVRSRGTPRWQVSALTTACPVYRG